MAKQHNWTVNKETGRTNSSPEFLNIVQSVKELIARETNGKLDSVEANALAYSVVGLLAHGHNFGPQRPVEYKENANSEELSGEICWCGSMHNYNKKRGIK